MQFRLSEGIEANERQQSLPAPPASPLSDDATNNLLKRLPPIQADADDQKDFARICATGRCPRQKPARPSPPRFLHRTTPPRLKQR